RAPMRGARRSRGLAPLSGCRPLLPRARPQRRNRRTGAHRNAGRARSLDRSGDRRPRLREPPRRPGCRRRLIGASWPTIIGAAPAAEEAAGEASDPVAAPRAPAWHRARLFFVGGYLEGTAYESVCVGARRDAASYDAALPMVALRRPLSADDR